MKMHKCVGFTFRNKIKNGLWESTKYPNSKKGSNFMNNDDANMSDLLKKAQEMIDNNQVPDSIKEMMKNLNTNNNTSNFDSQTNSNNIDDKISSSNINFENLSNISNIINSNRSDDDMSKLLLALKPYLRDKKQNKIDDYINLIKMGKAAKLMEIINKNSAGGDSK